MIDSIKERYDELTEDKTIGWWIALTVIVVLGTLIISLVLYNAPELIMVCGIFFLLWLLWACLGRVVNDKWYWE